MEKLRPKIIIEDYKNNFDYKKDNSNLNIQFNRVAFVFFFFFIIYLIYAIHLIHLGSRKSKTELNNDVPRFANKLYRADIIDVNGNYLAKTVKSIDIGIKTSDVIDKKKLLLSLNIIFPDKDFNKIKKQLDTKKFFWLEKKVSEENYEKLMKLGDKSIKPEEKVLRIYPQKNLFSHILGQTNDINDNTYWGLFASNYSKNISFDQCVFSRFDAHMGVYNATIRNSTMGYMGINAIGSGKFLIENSTIRGRSLVNLRQDYGSTWEGDFFIKNCVFVPSKRKSGAVSVFSGANSGIHDFGYTCYMPKNITIDQLHIDTSNLEDDNKSISLFANFNPKMINEDFKEDFPYIRTKKVSIEDLSISGNQKLKLSENPFMFKDVKIKKD